MTEAITVYAHIVGRKTKFNFRFSESASVAGKFVRYYHDEAYTWMYWPSPGLGANPSDKWICAHKPID